VTSGSMTPSILQKRIGARVKAARTDRGLTQEQVAKQVGMIRSSIANLEAGRQDMNISRLALVAAAVGLDFGELIRPEDLPALHPLPPPPHDVAIRRVYEVDCRTCRSVIDAPPSHARALEVRRDHIAQKREEQP
jgi:transcriptional regulator with XRE-family HTH domain